MYSRQKRTENLRARDIADIKTRTESQREGLRQLLSLTMTVVSHAVIAADERASWPKHSVLSNHLLPCSLLSVLGLSQFKLIIGPHNRYMQNTDITPNGSQRRGYFLLSSMSNGPSPSKKGKG